MTPPPVIKTFDGPCIVVATGPSLTDSAASLIRLARWFGPFYVIVVSDAHRMIPTADALYSCDESWWKVHDGAKAFRGERWSSHGLDDKTNDKQACAERYGLKLVGGKHGVGFSTDQRHLHYGGNSGFQAVNLAILKGATAIVLAGFDMRRAGGKVHFFGDHPAGLRNNDQFDGFIKAFEQANPPPVPIINGTPDSAMKCYERLTLWDALDKTSRDWHRAVPHGFTDRRLQG